MAWEKPAWPAREGGFGRGRHSPPGPVAEWVRQAHAMGVDRGAVGLALRGALSGGAWLGVGTITARSAAWGASTPW